MPSSTYCRRWRHKYFFAGQLRAGRAYRRYLSTLEDTHLAYLAVGPRVVRHQAQRRGFARTRFVGIHVQRRVILVGVLAHCRQINGIDATQQVGLESHSGIRTGDAIGQTIVPQITGVIGLFGAVDQRTGA